jgi:hypothetical protein
MLQDWEAAGFDAAGQLESATVAPAALIQITERVCWPPPHVTLHALQLAAAFHEYGVS